MSLLNFDVLPTPDEYLVGVSEVLKESGQDIDIEQLVSDWDVMLGEVGNMLKANTPQSQIELIVWMEMLYDDFLDMIDMANSESMLPKEYVPGAREVGVILFDYMKTMQKKGTFENMSILYAEDDDVFASNGKGLLSTLPKFHKWFVGLIVLFFVLSSLALIVNAPSADPVLIAGFFGAAQTVFTVPKDIQATRINLFEEAVSKQPWLLVNPETLFKKNAKGKIEVLMTPTTPRDTEQTISGDVIDLVARKGTPKGFDAKLVQGNFTDSLTFKPVSIYEEGVNVNVRVKYVDTATTGIDAIVTTRIATDDMENLLWKSFPLLDHKKKYQYFFGKLGDDGSYTIPNLGRIVIFKMFMNNALYAAVLAVLRKAMRDPEAALWTHYGVFGRRGGEYLLARTIWSYKLPMAVVATTFAVITMHNSYVTLGLTSELIASLGLNDIFQLYAKIWAGETISKAAGVGAVIGPSINFFAKVFRDKVEKAAKDDTKWSPTALSLWVADLFLPLDLLGIGYNALFEKDEAMKAAVEKTLRALRPPEEDRQRQLSPLRWGPGVPLGIE